jgi:hypothetical protein
MKSSSSIERPTKEEFLVARAQAQREELIDAADNAYQVCRWFRGQIFLREDAEKWLTEFRRAPK